ncbi:ABC transporter substrate-binding protein [Bacillus sp. DTU_2020_1000418_1_SI_GHA_SEK_038]|uniref:ABC transporter substrate-binding protein n=1 Tax=Bacillus sp. DTU_2020_1000418_1_SI_GHA_SEK_038 TaxID=3077585 RepID=UPI0028E7899B|nr:ABC transporter substrate-binding protein [Bacillus sp. DTU_2020_1000418_1_SI_GHA_SEK_038]WNS74140.1 ABC transporter substrate-binding protein [Bacillus sp. DTU_2020_1000418_1_SI_GHA_SEK_038]
MLKVRGSKKNSFIMVIVFTMLLVLAGCGGGSAEPANQNDGDNNVAKQNMTIVVQPGLGYAPLTILREMAWLDEELPNVNIEWKTLASGAAIRDGLLAGQIQVGAGGIGPFLLGWDKGVKWKILSSMDNMELWLMGKDPNKKSLKDFGPKDQIAMPGLDSIQSVVLRKGALEELGDARSLDENMVALEHPTAMQALLSDQITAHLTSPPYQMQEEAEGAHIILKSYDLFGEHTFNSIWVTEDYYNDNREIMDVLYKNVQRAIDLLNDDPAQAAEILSKDSDGSPSAEQYKEWITQDYIQYTTKPNGFINFAEVMKELKMIDKIPACEDILHENLGNPGEC